MRVRELMVVCAVVLASCSANSSNNTAPESDGCEVPKDKGPIVIFAASSLSNVLNSIESDYLASHPCVTDLVFSYGSSATLAAQILNDAPADIFMSASKTVMDSVENADRMSESIPFASNSAAIMRFQKSTYFDDVISLSDLVEEKNPGIKVGLCVTTAPCGSLADLVLENARQAYGNVGLTRQLVADTEAPSAEDLVSKIHMGELDAGVVYQSDCFSETEKLSVKVCVNVPPSYNNKKVNAATIYYGGAISKRLNSREFMKYVVSADFQNLLQSSFGFGAP